MNPTIKPTDERLTNFTTSAPLPVLDRLDEIAKATNLPRSALVREGLRRIIAEHDRRERIATAIASRSATDRGDLVAVMLPRAMTERLKAFADRAGARGGSNNGGMRHVCEALLTIALDDAEEVFR